MGIILPGIMGIMQSLTVALLVAMVGCALSEGLGPFPYRGRYPGYCDNGDGLYVHDWTDIYFCSGGIATRQQCAPGTRHSHATIHKLNTYVGKNICTDYHVPLCGLCDEVVPVEAAPAPHEPQPKPEPKPEPKPAPVYHAPAPAFHAPIYPLHAPVYYPYHFAYPLHNVYGH